MISEVVVAVISLTALVAVTIEVYVPVSGYVCVIIGPASVVISPNDQVYVTSLPPVMVAVRIVGCPSTVGLLLKTLRPLTGINA